MNLRVNGETIAYDHISHVGNLIDALNLHPNTVLVELNGKALFRHEWEGVQLKEGDSLEIIRVVAGG